MPVKMVRSSPSAAVRCANGGGSRPRRQSVLDKRGKAQQSTSVRGSSGESPDNASSISAVVPLLHFLQIWA